MLSHPVLGTADGNTLAYTVPGKLHGDGGKVPGTHTKRGVWIITWSSVTGCGWADEVKFPITVVEKKHMCIEFLDALWEFVAGRFNQMLRGYLLDGCTPLAH